MFGVNPFAWAYLAQGYAVAATPSLSIDFSVGEPASGWAAAVPAGGWIVPSGIFGPSPIPAWTAGTPVV